MKKYKISVYAICKNEEKFVDRWVNSMKEADEIYVLDTGSTDNTVNKLKEHGVTVVTKIIEPWRFDVARNLSLDIVSEDTDICVCTDLDEVFIPGWRQELENSWNKNTTKARYNYNWSLTKDNTPLVNFYIEKIHNRHSYKWTHPVHEILTYIEDKKEEIITIDNITLNHFPDTNKSRSSYLPLLELSIKEDPEDDRNMHYLGREYMYYHRWNECINTLKKHLNLKKATWKDERAASMRFIARSYRNLSKYEEAIYWYNKAIKEAPHLRDAYVELAILYYNLKDWDKVIINNNKALEITTKYKSYINETFSWDNTIYDLNSIAYYHKKDYNKAIENVITALSFNKENERLINNLKLYIQKNK